MYKFLHTQDPPFDGTFGRYPSTNDLSIIKRLLFTYLNNATPSVWIDPPPTINYQELEVRTHKRKLFPFLQILTSLNFDQNLNKPS